MPQKRLKTFVNLEPKYLDISNWPIVNTMQLSTKDKEIYSKREAAVSLYMNREMKLERIKEITGIQKKELLKFVERCLEYDPNTSMIWGFRALIPHKRISDYKRKAPTKINSNNGQLKFNGAFGALMRQYPEIEKKIISAYLRRRESSAKTPVMNGDEIHRYFLKQCEKVGIGIHEYPFNTNDKAFRSIYRFLKKVENSHFVEASKLNGNEAARQAIWGGNKKEDDLILNVPYQRVQFDGHKIDAIFTISFTTPEGDIITEVIDRIWLLVIVDVATKTIIGHHLCVNKEYNLDDVLHCIRNAIIPYKKISFTIPGISYHPDGGLPSAEIPEAAWALWNEFSIDNGKSNLANMVKDRLHQVVGCTLNPGPVEMPEVRGIIERLFRTLEGLGYRKLISTTGSHPSDPIRSNPETQAKKYDISLSDLEELTHVLVSDYNGIPNSGSRNFAPLKLMKQRIERGMEPRTLELEKRNVDVFFTVQVKRNVNGNIKQGKRPFIHYEGTTYRNDILSNSAHLIGTELTLLVNIEDIRTIRAFLPDGSEFGYLTAYGAWGITPHSLRTRKAINKLKKERKIFFNTYQDPFQIYHDYKVSKAKTIKSERNKLAQLQRELQLAEFKQQKIEEKESSQVQENLPNWHNISIKEDDVDDRRIFRTYNF